MTTRGFIGFVAEGKEFISYNGADSYPEGLGLHFLEWLRSYDHKGLQKAKQQASNLITVEAPPGNQGDPLGILEVGRIDDASDWPLNSLFCEWGYLVDFDSEVFEVYKGFQKKPHSKGRFAERRPLKYDDYYPVALVESWSLDELPETRDFCHLVEVAIGCYECAGRGGFEIDNVFYKCDLCNGSGEWTEEQD